MSRQKKILKDIGSYSFSILITQAVTVAASILTRRFLGPTQMGVWAFLQTLLIYAEYSALGVTTAASYEIPLHNGRGEHEKARRVTNATFSFALLTALAVSFCVVVYALLKRQALREELFYGFLIGAGFVILQRFSGLVITVVRARKEFAVAGKQMLYSSILNAVLIAVFSYRFKIYGFLAAMALSLLFNIAYLMYKARLRFSFSSDWRQMSSLVRFGLPLMAVGFSVSAFETLDRLFITRFLGFEALGLYSVALMVLNTLNGIPNAVGVVTMSHLQERYGETEDTADLRRYVKKVDAGYGILMAALAGASWFLAPWLVRFVLPQFTGGVGAIQFLVLGAYFTAMSQGYSQLIYVIRKHYAFLFLLPIAGLATAAADLMALRAGLGVEGVAMATAFGSFFYFTLLFFYGSLRIETFFEAFRRYAGILGFFLLMAASLFAIDRRVVIGAPVIAPWVQAAIFLIVLSPFFLRANREFGLKIPWPSRASA